MSLRVREAQPRDAEALAALNAQTWRESYDGLLPAQAAEGQARGPSFWRTTVTRARVDEGSRDDELFLADFDGAPAGFVWAGAARAEETPWEGEIFMLYVLQARQRQGAGRALFSAAAGHLARRGFFSWGAWCVADNAIARGFYEHLGGASAASGAQILNGVRVPVIGYAWRDVMISSPES